MLWQRGAGTPKMKRGMVIMYKKQMTAQKVICLLALIASVLAFAYSLGMMTDLYDTLSPATTHINWARKQLGIEEQTDFGFSILKDMQPFNRDLLSASIGLILLSCLLFITNTASRRRYYIANYVSTGLSAVAGIGVAIWARTQVETFRVQYSAMNHEALAKIMTEKVMRSNKTYVYAPSETWFNLYYVVFAALLLVSMLLILNAIWKTWLMKEEKRLLKEGKAVAK